MRPAGNHLGNQRRKPQEHEVKCYCGAPMKLRYSPKFKGGNWFYGCSRYPACSGAHGCHQDSGKPLGKPADQETKNWRIKAHAAFDGIWKGGFKTRKQAYEWLAEQFGVKEIHIGESDIETCQKIEEVCVEWLFEAVKNHNLNELHKDTRGIND